MNNELGNYLLTLRKQYNYTQAFAAQQIGVIRQTYSHYKTGRVQPPVKILCRLADLYRIPIGILLNLTNGNQDKEQQKDSMELYQLTKKEQELILFHRLLDERAKEDVFELAAMLAKKNRNQI